MQSIEDRSVIACSLESADFSQRQREWREVLTGKIVDSVRTESGVRLLLRQSPDTLEALRELIAQEQHCCPWINWSLTILDGEPILEASADNAPEAQVVAEMFEVAS